jgi:hypothetical protein
MFTKNRHPLIALKYLALSGMLLMSISSTWAVTRISKEEQDAMDAFEAATAPVERAELTGNTEPNPASQATLALNQAPQPAAVIGAQAQPVIEVVAAADAGPTLFNNSPYANNAVVTYRIGRGNTKSLGHNYRGMIGMPYRPIYARYYPFRTQYRPFKPVYRPAYQRYNRVISYSTFHKGAP